MFSSLPIRPAFPPSPISRENRLLRDESKKCLPLIYSSEMRLIGLLPVFLFIAAAFATACFPRIMPRLTNAWYSKIGMKTRVIEEDYDKLPTRIAGAVLLVVGLFVGYRILVSGH